MITQASQWRPTLLVGPPPVADAEINKGVQELSTALQAMCGELKVPYLDSFLPLVTAEVWMREVAIGDGAHPSAGGYALLADLVGRWGAWQAWMTPI
jgi:lysophospholipase L1-like esterase